MVCGAKISRNFLKRVTDFPQLLLVNDSKKLPSAKRRALFH
jgi:ribonuclease HII